MSGKRGVKRGTLTIELQTTELDKMHKVHPQSQAVGEFLEWLQEENLALCRYDKATRQYYPNCTSVEDLLAKHFGIDLDKVERERRAILDGIRAANDSRGA
jgi:hypothetical protein